MYIAMDKHIHRMTRFFDLGINMLGSIHFGRIHSNTFDGNTLRGNCVNIFSGLLYNCCSGFCRTSERIIQ